MTLRICLGALALCLTGWAGNWPEWRGPSGNLRSPETGLPVKWSASENIAWKLALPDRSGSTPIIWGSRIFLNVATGEFLELWCVDKGTGSVIWKRPLGNGNHKINKQNMSSPSPVTDGEHVWVLTGTGVLKAFDFDGKQLWSHDLPAEYGAFLMKWGYASSPLLYRDSVVVQVLHGNADSDKSYLVRYDKLTGKLVWRVERATGAVREGHDSYRTPAIFASGGRTEILTADGDAVTGHDFTTGKELWRGRGLNPEGIPSNRVIPSVFTSGDLIYVPSRVKPLLAFRAGGNGDVTASHLAWSLPLGPDVPTPVTDGKYLYLPLDRGIVHCVDAITGAIVYTGKRIHNGTYSSSPVLADGKLYITSEDGVTTVLKAGPEFQVLGENELPGFTLSTIAISDGRLYLRTAEALFAIGK